MSKYHLQYIHDECKAKCIFFLGLVSNIFKRCIFKRCMFLFIPFSYNNFPNQLLNTPIHVAFSQSLEVTAFCVWSTKEMVCHNVYQYTLFLLNIVV